MTFNAIEVIKGQRPILGHLRQVGSFVAFGAIEVIYDL